MKKTSFTIPLSPAQMETAARILASGNYRARSVPYALAAAEAEDCSIVLYESGKCVVQGKGAEDWVLFTLEPLVLQEARLGYEDVHDPSSTQPHMGVDESGKGDFFGPLVISAAYVDPAIAEDLRRLDVRDSKTISSDKVARDKAEKIRERLGQRFSMVVIGPAAYNRLHGTMGTVNKILAWGHARAIEDLLERVPDCPRALSDQFGPTRQIEAALLKRGRAIKLEQRPKAESDIAVAAASILARAGFLAAMDKLSKQYDVLLPKGASDRVKAAAVELVKRHGGHALLDSAKCHFKTTDEVLASAGTTRAASELPPAPAPKAAYVPRKPKTF